VAVALNRVRALQENVACPDTPADAAALAARPGGLGVTRAGAYEQALRNQDKKINLVVFDTERELHDALETDKLLAGLGGEIELRQLFALHPAARIKLKLCLVDEQKDQIAIAVRPDAPNLAAWIDVVLDNVGLQLKPSGIFTLGTDWTFRAASEKTGSERRAGELVGRIRALVKKVPARKDGIEINDAILEVIAQPLLGFTVGDFAVDAPLSFDRSPALTGSARRHSPVPALWPRPQLHLL
jgi:hypothetical protein